MIAQPVPQFQSTVVAFNLGFRFTRITFSSPLSSLDGFRYICQIASCGDYVMIANIPNLQDVYSGSATFCTVQLSAPRGRGNPVAIPVALIPKHL